MNGNTYGAKATRLLCAWGDALGRSAASLARAYVSDPAICITPRGDVVVRLTLMLSIASL